jgi:hypothetical protein
VTAFIEGLTITLLPYLLMLLLFFLTITLLILLPILHFSSSSSLLFLSFLLILFLRYFIDLFSGPETDAAVVLTLKKKYCRYAPHEGL